MSNERVAELVTYLRRNPPVGIQSGLHYFLTLAPADAAFVVDAIESWVLAEQLRENEGANVILLCDNPEFNGKPNNAIEIVDDWTQWTVRRFEGETMLDCLRAALAARPKAPAVTSTRRASPDEPRDALGQTASEVYSSAFAPPTLREALENLLKDIDESQALGMPVLLRRDTIAEARAVLALSSTDLGSGK